MRLTSPALLKTVFYLKKNFSPGVCPPVKKAEGVEIAPFRSGAKGAVTISADFELNWAWRGKSAAERDAMGERERANVPFIVRILEEFELPITWATVGHLFLNGCRAGNGKAHADMPRPRENFGWSGDWYLHDPCADISRAPLWYCPDLIEEIIESSVHHEIGTHSFSHIDFSSETSDRQLVASEINECIRAMEPFGLKPKSLVFPFNKMGHQHLDLLFSLGIIAVRHRDARVRLSYPERTRSGVYKIYESMNLRSTEAYDYAEKARIFLEEAVKKNALYHLWFHPSAPRELFDHEFRAIAGHISDMREQGLLWVATMRDVVSYCEARDRAELRVMRTDRHIDIALKRRPDHGVYGRTDLSLVLPVQSLPKKVELAGPKGIKHPAAARDMFLHDVLQKIVLNVPSETDLVRVTL